MPTTTSAPRPSLRLRAVLAALAAAAVVITLAPEPARAQTIGGAVQDHADQNLEHKKRSKPKSRLRP